MNLGLTTFAWRPPRRGFRARGRRIGVLVAIFGALASLGLCAPGAAQAHPLGNFTINRYAGIELSGGRVYVHYVLDLA